MKNRYRFKKATTEEELAQIFRLNHSVFAGELGQYPTEPSGVLVDRFHEKNTYLVALHEEQVVGMIALHDQPPFSVAGRLTHPHAALAGLGRLMEVRMLAVEPAHRNGRVMAGLMLQLYELARAYDTIVISGHADRVSIYHELGFQDLGPAVKSGAASYIPMAVRLADLVERQARWKARLDG